MSIKKKYQKPTTLSFIVSTDPFPFDILVSIGQDDKQLAATLKRYGKVLDKDIHVFQKETIQAFYSMDEQNCSLIRMRVFPESNKDYAHLHHEIFHAVFNILDRVGVKPTEDSEEVYAYSIQYVTHQIYDKLRPEK